jgi:hypothetical protein
MSEYKLVGWAVMGGGIGKDMGEHGCGLVWGVSPKFTWRVCRKPLRIWVIIVPAGVRTQHLLPHDRSLRRVRPQSPPSALHCCSHTWHQHLLHVSSHTSQTPDKHNASQSVCFCRRRTKQTAFEIFRWNLLTWHPPSARRSGVCQLGFGFEHFHCTLCKARTLPVCLIKAYRGTEA